MALSIPNTFVAGTTAKAADVNANFTAIETWANSDVVVKDGTVAMTGPLTLSGLPSQSGHAASKAYVDRTAGKVLGVGSNTSDTLRSLAVEDTFYTVSGLSVTTDLAANHWYCAEAWVPSARVTNGYPIRLDLAIFQGSTRKQTMSARQIDVGYVPLHVKWVWKQNTTESAQTITARVAQAGTEPHSIFALQSAERFSQIIVSDLGYDAS